MPASGDNLLHDSLRALARAALRDRAVLHEGRRRDELTRRGRKHQPLKLTPGQTAALPLLTAHLAAHPAPDGEGWPPSITRSSAAILRDLDTLHAARGSLVLLTVTLDDLDDLALKGPDLAPRARLRVAAILRDLALPKAPYRAAVQRGVYGGTHVHLVLALADLLPTHAALVMAAPAGPGGGCLLLEGVAHGVRVRDRKIDRVRVAGYLARDPEARLHDPMGDTYLEALEDELARRAAGVKSPRLGWAFGIVALRRSSCSKRVTLAPSIVPGADVQDPPPAPAEAVEKGVDSVCPGFPDSFLHDLTPEAAATEGSCLRGARGDSPPAYDALPVSAPERLARGRELLRAWGILPAPSESGLPQAPSSSANVAFLANGKEVSGRG